MEGEKETMAGEIVRVVVTMMHGTLPDTSETILDIAREAAMNTIDRDIVVVIMTRATKHAEDGTLAKIVIDEGRGGREKIAENELTIQTRKGVETSRRKQNERNKLHSQVNRSQQVMFQIGFAILLNLLRRQWPQARELFVFQSSS